jgi:hypothetical protein
MNERAAAVVIPSRRARFRMSPFETMFAACAVISGTFNLLNRESVQQSNLNTIVPLWWVYGINAGYAIGGALILAGIWRGRPGVEAAGLIELATFLTINAIVITQVRGLAALSSIAIFVAMSAAALWRARTVTRYQPVTWAEIGGE